MQAKVAVVIVSIGASACGLLALRQSRLQAAHELTRSQFRIRAADERLWMLRAEIAKRVAPPEVEAMAAGVDDLKPIVAQSLSREETERLANAGSPEETPQ